MGAKSGHQCTPMVNGMMFLLSSLLQMKTAVKTTFIAANVQKIHESVAIALLGKAKVCQQPIYTINTGFAIQ